MDFDVSVSEVVTGGYPACGMVGKVFHIVSATLLSRHKFVSTKSPTGALTDEEFIQIFFRYLKTVISDKYRSDVKSTGPHVAHIHHKIMNHGNDIIDVSIDNVHAIQQLYCKKFGMECVVSVLIYMGVDEISYHPDFVFDVYQVSIRGNVFRFWTQCEDPDMLEWLLDNNPYGAGTGTLCDIMIEHNVQLGRGENVMRLLRWKHDNLGYNGSSPMRLD